MASNKNLEGILKWSLAQSDGTAPARQITDEERKWFSEAMAVNTVDVVQRMKEISMVMGLAEESLLAQGVTVDEIAGMLEELQEHVECIDVANDLKAIGGLDPLLRYLRSPNPLLRARAAEVVATMAQNNPQSQKHVLDAGGVLTLTNMFLNDADVVARTKALGAISSLTRHNAEALDIFRSAGGVKGLVAVMATATDPRLERKVLHVARYVFQQRPQDQAEALSDGLPSSLSRLVGSSDAGISHSAVELASDLLRTPEGSRAIFQREGNAAQELKQAVVHRMSVVDGEGVAEEDKEALSEERHALGSLKSLLERGPSGPQTGSSSGSIASASAGQQLLLLGAPRP